MIFLDGHNTLGCGAAAGAGRAVRHTIA